MSKVVVERETPVVESDGGTGSSAVWAITFLLIVGLIIGALYYSGALRRITQPAQQKVNVEVQAP